MIEDYRPQSIACPEALRRRIDVYAEVRARDEFCTQRNGVMYLDPRKVKARFGTSKHPDVYNIRLKDSLSGDPIIGKLGDSKSQWISYNQFIACCVESYERKFVSSSEMHDFLAELAVKPLIRPQVGVKQYFGSFIWKPREITPFDMSQADWSVSSPRLKDDWELFHLNQSQISSVASELDAVRNVFSFGVSSQIFLHRDRLMSMSAEAEMIWSGILR
jgi:hypothetical protein